MVPKKQKKTSLFSVRLASATIPRPFGTSPAPLLPFKCGWWWGGGVTGARTSPSDLARGGRQRNDIITQILWHHQLGTHWTWTSNLMFSSQKDTHFSFIYLFFLRRRRLLGQKRKRGGVSGGNVSHLHGLRRTWGKQIIQIKWMDWKIKCKIN